MKWIYRILRIFFCPHVWNDKETLSKLAKREDGIHRQVGIVYVKQCKRCKKIQDFTVEI